MVIVLPFLGRRFHNNNREDNLPLPKAMSPLAKKTTTLHNLNSQNPVVRHFFPETWIWTDITLE